MKTRQNLELKTMKDLLVINQKTMKEGKTEQWVPVMKMVNLYRITTRMGILLLDMVI
jgi:hypothetical protein